jgi:hypothetical protein
MADFQVLPSNFNETTITFVCVSTAAKSRMNGAVSVQVRKSAAPDFYAQLEAEGFSLAE